MNKNQNSKKVLLELKGCYVTTSTAEWHPRCRSLSVSIGFYPTLAMERSTVARYRGIAQRSSSIAVAAIRAAAVTTEIDAASALEGAAAAAVAAGAGAKPAGDTEPGALATPASAVQARTTSALNSAKARVRVDHPFSV